MSTAAIIVVAILALFVIVTVAKAIMVVPQAQSAVIERLGRFRSVASPGLNFLVPFLDKVRARIDLREQVVSFPPQPVITQDNLTVSIDTVVYFQVTDSRAAVYEISNYIVGVEQLTTTTLRNLVGGMSLEDTLTSRDQINGQLRGVLDEATGRWGIRVARVELKAIDPPPSIQDSMEKQMRADREKRAMILTAEGQRESAIKTAEGQKQSQILAAEGSKQAAILAAEAERQSRILRAQGERAARYLQAQGQAKAIEKVFAAIKAGKPTPEVLAYQYLQTLPQMAQGDANKVWLVPSDYGKSLEGFARALGAPGEDGVFRYEPPKDDQAERPQLDDDEVASWFDTTTDPKVAEAVREAEAVARQEVPGPLNTGPGTARPVPSALSSLRGGADDEGGGETGPPPLPKRSPEAPAPEFQRRTQEGLPEGGQPPAPPASPAGPQGGPYPPQGGPYQQPPHGGPPRQQ
ncbi:SPFH domain-containing protein [Amycolatopsis cihanbeyliensis]|uniref:Regulator of protease activity HflC (Stomatin/prohibitin superfamily) n=1 Tax=Amycolatopsis cihanbeyliensis TaxID=1128664 RepID=A0A542DC41_AMYCI|nr:SPFH domain-containing protein [Amycolatopsis cihanbeyliensis]TQJ00623.1 regulator of protease activity HflC (stomatin/prohibitin superfamily) [Amycolatopsis cihanbeyliensis]